ncbi:MAG: outer membrane protein assembly factor BamD [Verrucomicrobiales bacterium]|nr:outer membrane protein assembly factor BamD [Verrucomicrobiales bacterium]
MNRRTILLLVVLVGFFAWPWRCYAPLVYRPGEGWTYETPGSTGSWQRGRAEDQYGVAKEAYAARRFRLATKAARRTVVRWPRSDYAAQAQYLLGLCYEARKWDERAFREYQKAIERYPKSQEYENIIERQFAIAQRFLGGQWFKLWGVIPFFPSMEKTADMLSKIVRNGPYSEIAPAAQMAIGTAREKQKDYYLAVKAYEKAADTYHDQPEIAAEALHRAAKAYEKQAKTAEYDQGAASQAIAAYTDFMALYPRDPRVEEAQQTILSLRTEQARGAYRIAQFYDKKRRWDGARVYYNEVVSKDPNSEYAAAARKRLDLLRNVRSPAPRNP